MAWLLLGVIVMAGLGLYALSLLNTDKKPEVDETLANVLKDHVTRAENGPTARKGRNQ